MKASRPRMPSAYGIPKDTKSVLPWSHASKRMSEALHYWVCTVDSKGRPHATPVDGLWLTRCISEAVLKRDGTGT